MNIFLDGNLKNGGSKTLLIFLSLLFLNINMVSFIAGTTWIRWSCRNSEPWSHPRTDLLTPSVEVQMWVLLEEEVSGWEVIFGLWTLCFNAVVRFLLLWFNIYCRVSSFQNPCFCLLFLNSNCTWLSNFYKQLYFLVQIDIQDFYIVATKLIKEFCLAWSVNENQAYVK